MLIHKTIGTCRYVYNLYLEKNKEQYKNKASSSIMTGSDFSKWLNNIYSKQDEFKWIKEVSSKAVKQSIRMGKKLLSEFLKRNHFFQGLKRKGNKGKFY